MFVSMEPSEANLDTRAQNFQLRLGVVMIALSLGVAVALVRAEVGTAYRLLVALPMYFGTYAVYAGLTKTCGFTALRGLRMTASGPAPVADKAELAAQRRRGLRVIASSAAVAGLATLLLAVAH